MLMFLLNMQRIESILIELSILISKGCIQRKRLFLICHLPTLWVTNLFFILICFVRFQH